MKGKNMQTETRWMGKSDNTSGVNKRKRKKQNMRREPESQPGQGNGRIGGEENSEWKARSTTAAPEN